MAPASVDVDLSDAPEAAPGEITIKLKQPVKMGTHTIEELTLKFSPRAFKEFSVPLKDDGTVIFTPYVFAAAGVRLAGQPSTVLDRLGAADFFTLARATLSFLG